MGLDYLDIMLRVEKEFGVQLPDPQEAGLETVEDLFTCLLTLITTDVESSPNRICHKCRYDLRVLTTPYCPECGAPIYGDMDTSVEAWKALTRIIEDATGIERACIKPSLTLVKDLGL